MRGVFGAAIGALLISSTPLMAAINGTVNWTRSLPITEAYGVAADAGGNSYAVGQTSGVLGPGGTGQDNAFVRRYDLGGNIVWTVQHGGVGVTTSADAVAVDANNVYVTGSSTNTPLSGIGFVRKYDLGGNLAWHRDISPVDDWMRSIAVDASGNVYAGGQTTASLGQSHGGSGDAFVRKYDAAGNVQWTRQFGNVGSDVVRGLTVDPSGNLIAVGDVSTNVLGVPGTGGGAFVRKYDPAGNAVWTQKFGFASSDFATGVDTDANGNVYLAGRTSQSLYGTNAGSTDVFAAKYDSSGNFVWGKQIGSVGGESFPSIAVDDVGNALMVGSGGNLDPTTYSGGTDAFVIAVNAAGLTQWTQHFGTNLSNDGRGVALSADGTRGWMTQTDFNASSDDSVVRHFNVVPEPGAIALAAFAMLGCVRRRRR